LYCYSLHGWEESTIITNKNKFTQKKFEKMCKEAPKGHVVSRDYYDTRFIIKYLIKNYGFQKLKVTSGFFIDGDVE
jgi:hypothetical protein